MSEWIRFEDQEPEIDQAILAHCVNRQWTVGGYYRGLQGGAYRIDSKYNPDDEQGADYYMITASYWLPIPPLPELPEEE